MKPTLLMAEPVIEYDLPRGGSAGTPAGCLPAPEPALVAAARAHLGPRYAVGVDAVLWELMEHPPPDLDAVDAVIAAGRRAEAGGGGELPSRVEVAAALLVLAAARLDLDQVEVALLNTAQTCGLAFEQVAAVWEMSAGEVEERYRRLKPRLDEPVAQILPRPIGDVLKVAASDRRRSHRPRSAGSRIKGR